MTTDFTYDFPVSSNSLQVPIPHKQMRRKRSPSPSRVHFPHHSTKYSPSTRAADISRLLDPSYSSSTSSSPTSVYVDHRGDLHDPDYRDFPLVAAHTHSRRVTRPRWEQAVDDDEELDDEPASSSRFDVKHRTHRDSVSTYGRPSYSTYYYETHEVSPPTSYESADTVLEEHEDSPFADENEKKPSSRVARYACPKKAARKAEEKRLRAVLEREHEEETQGIVSEKPADTEYTPSRTLEDQDWTPTCTQSIRREWQAISLRFRFGVFRAKRKVKRRIGL